MIFSKHVLHVLRVCLPHASNRWLFLNKLLAILEPHACHVTFRVSYTLSYMLNAPFSLTMSRFPYSILHVLYVYFSLAVSLFLYLILRVVCAFFLSHHVAFYIYYPTCLIRFFLSPCRVSYTLSYMLYSLTMAPPARAGGSVTLRTGKRTPAATGSPTVLYLRCT